MAKIKYSSTKKKVTISQVSITRGPPSNCDHVLSITDHFVLKGKLTPV